MIASLRGLLVLAVVAVLLAIAVVIDAVRAHGPVDRRIIHQDVSYTQRLTWPGLVAQRAGDGWQSVNLTGNPGEEPGIVTLDTDAIKDVLRTLESARWHRRGGTPGTIHTTLDVDGTKIAIGDQLPGTDQTWLVVDGTPLLVDGWVARALAPGALALHVRHPFASSARSAAITIFGGGFDLKLTGQPRRHASGVFASVDATRVLEQALADVEVVALGTPNPHGAGAPGSDEATDSDVPTGVEVSLDTVTERVTGTCPALTDLISIHGLYGDECITKAAWDRVLEAARAVTDKIELRPVLGEPTTATLADGTQIDLRSDAASALVHALTTPALDRAPPGDLLELTHLVVATRGGDKAELRVRPHDVVQRVADSAVLQLAHADWLALQAPAATYADPTRWSEDPSAVAAITVGGAAGGGGVTYRRGAVLGEWTPTKPLDPKALEDLAAALARVEARDASSAPGQRTHSFTVTLAPPVGAKATHTLDVGDKCNGRIDGKPVTFEPATCAALARAVH